MQPMPSADEVDLAVEVFRMLSDGTRLRLLWCLTQRPEMSVNDLAAAVDKSATSVSQHLAKLRLARLVQTRRDGVSILYRLDSDHARRLVVEGVHHAEHQGDRVPAHHAGDAPAHLEVGEQR
ncbi:transcriptional regulator [Aeromicrobium sp. IC_218]|nr:transcriptional regulator [Aeromicrobium sp. IC_218]